MSEGLTVHVGHVEKRTEREGVVSGTVQRSSDDRAPQPMLPSGKLNSSMASWTLLIYRHFRQGASLKHVLVDFWFLFSESGNCS